MNASQNRREFKFLLTQQQFEAVRSEVGDRLPVDQGAENGYQIISEYFDTAERSTYWQKQFGSPNRRRVRTRLYGALDGERSPTAFVEVKHKLNGVTVKRRVLVGLDELNDFASGVIPERECENDSRVLKEIKDLIQDPDRLPVVRIRYHRYAYDSGPEGTIRITFDANTCCWFDCENGYGEETSDGYSIMKDADVIMEIKTIGSVPYWFRNLIAKHKILPRGFSKFSSALELYDKNLKLLRELRNV